jgi:ABC-type transport system substrate-binding protein
LRFPLSLFLLTLIIVLILTGHPSHSQESYFDRLRIGFVLKGEYNTNPICNNYIYEREINELVFGTGLFRKDTQGLIFPALITFAQQEQPTRWKITLRGDITFHDRSPVTSIDVQFTMDLYKKFALQSAHLFKTRLISSMDILDERTIIINLKRPLQDFQESIGLLPILPKKYYGHWSDYNYISSLPPVQPVGCGYFLFRRAIPNREIHLSTNQYHYRGAAQLSGIDIYFYQTYEQVVEAFLNEEIDIIQVEDGQVFHKVRQFTESVKNVPVKSDLNDLYYINFNTKKAPFEDRNIRRALNFAINKNNIVEKDFVQRSHPVNNILAERSKYAPPKTITYAYDPLNSLTILENAGYRKKTNGKLFQNDQELKFILLFEEGSEFQESIVRLISINLAEIGINPVPQPLSAVEIEERIKNGDYQAVLQSYLFDPSREEEVIRHFYIEELNRSNGYKNYKTLEMDRILRRLEGNLPDQIALPNWQRMQVIINRDAPCVFLFSQDHVVYFIHERFINTTSQFEEDFEYKFKINPKHEWKVTERQLR